MLDYNSNYKYLNKIKRINFNLINIFKIFILK